MNTRVILGVVVIVAIGVAAFFFWPSQKAPIDQIVVDDVAPIQEEDPYRITHTFRKGTHTVEGVVTLPTPCHELREDIVVAESFPEQVRIDLRIIATDGICIQVIDEREFSIDVDVDEAASFTLSIDGVAVAVPNLGGN